MTPEQNAAVPIPAVGRVLYAFRFSGNSQRVRVFLSMLGLPFEERPIDIRQAEQRRPEFLAINPAGLVPVLIEDGRVLTDSHAILVWLAQRHGAGQWWPGDPWDLALVMQWLSFSANEIHHGPNLLRRHHRLGLPIDVEATTQRTLAVMQRLEDRLTGRDWLELGRPTLADIACYPYVEALPDARLSLEPYPAVRAWLGRIASLPGYRPMPAAAPAAA
ncbi:MAG: glutathione S-transferase [Burkholderiaceae bacterium]|nr:glutathione S-transferase [Burkholderiaceae bacterium]